ncbi:MAG: glycosyl hydrolase [Archangium sp.]|nr:glycosyl hydrolase [Archangium sp.]
MNRLLLLALVLPVQAFAQQIPPRSFFDLPSSNGHGAVMVDTRTGRLIHFREHLPATEEPELDAMGNERWIGNQPQWVKSRDLLFDAYFGIRVGGQQRWLDGATVTASSYAPGTGIITFQQQALGLQLTTSVFSPRSLPHAAYVAVLCARNTSTAAITGVSVFHLSNLHLGFGRPGVMTDLASNGETVLVSAAGDVFERGFAGVVGQRPLGTAIASAWNQSTDQSQNGFFIVRDTQGSLPARNGDLGVANDWASALQFELGTLQPNAEQCAGLVTAHHGDPFAQPAVTGWFDAWVAGRTARQVLDAELADWATLQAGLHLPPGSSPDELALTRQAAAILVMAQVQERQAFLREWHTQDGEARRTRFLDGGTLPATVVHRGQGAVLASLPPGEWTYSWVRDGSYAAVAMAELCLTAQSRAALSFFLDAEGGRFKNWTELQPAGFPNYVLSLTRYSGFGVEETDFNDFGPNLEFDGFGLVLWALREHELRTGDLTLVDARWADISTRIADPLVALIEPSTGLLRRDSSIWETHWNGRERTWTYTNLTAARGLCDAAELAQRKGDAARATTYRTAGQALRRAIGQKLTDPRGALVSNREELMAGRGHFDAAVLEGIAMGLFAADGRVAQATLDALERELKVPYGPGWARNDDRVDHPGTTDLSPWGSEYDSAEWVITDLRGAMAMRAAGRSSRADALLEFTRGQGAANALVFAETYEENSGAWKFNAPMVGFGAGAWVLALAHRGGLAITPACGAFEEPEVMVGVDAGVVDAGTMASDAGVDPPQPPSGCGCTSAPMVSLFALLAFTGRASTRARQRRQAKGRS